MIHTTESHSPHSKLTNLFLNVCVRFCSWKEKDTKKYLDRIHSYVRTLIETYWLAKYSNGIYHIEIMRRPSKHVTHTCHLLDISIRNIGIEDVLMRKHGIHFCSTFSVPFRNIAGNVEISLCGSACDSTKFDKSFTFDTSHFEISTFSPRSRYVSDNILYILVADSTFQPEMFPLKAYARSKVASKFCTCCVRAYCCSSGCIESE